MIDGGWDADGAVQLRGYGTPVLPRLRHVLWTGLESLELAAALCHTGVTLVFLRVRRRDFTLPVAFVLRRLARTIHTISENQLAPNANLHVSGLLPASLMPEAEEGFAIFATSLARLGQCTRVTLSFSTMEIPDEFSTSSLLALASIPNIVALEGAHSWDPFLPLQMGFTAVEKVSYWSQAPGGAARALRCMGPALASITLCVFNTFTSHNNQSNATAVFNAIAERTGLRELHIHLEYTAGLTAFAHLAPLLACTQLQVLDITTHREVHLTVDNLFAIANAMPNLVCLELEHRKSHRKAGDVDTMLPYAVLPSILAALPALQSLSIDIAIIITPAAPTTPSLHRRLASLTLGHSIIADGVDTEGLADCFRYLLQEASTLLFTWSGTSYNRRRPFHIIQRRRWERLIKSVRETGILHDITSL